MYLLRLQGDQLPWLVWLSGWASSCKPRGLQFNSRSGPILGCVLRPVLQPCERPPTDVSLPFSLPSSLSKNKWTEYFKKVISLLKVNIYSNIFFKGIMLLGKMISSICCSHCNASLHFWQKQVFIDHLLQSRHYTTCFIFPWIIWKAVYEAAIFISPTLRWGNWGTEKLRS